MSERNVIILFFFERAEDEAGVLNFASVLSGQLAGFVVPVESLGGGTRTYATFIRPAVFAIPPPDPEGAKGWAELELGTSVLRAEAKDIMLPTRNASVGTAAGKSERDCALALAQPGDPARARVLVVDMPPPRVHLV